MKSENQFRIEPLTKENAHCLHTANQPFDIVGNLELAFANGKWSAKEHLSDTVTQKQYPNYDGATADDYTGNLNRAAFFAFDSAECIGQILLSKTWNGYAHIEDISVARARRGKGVGKALLEKAETWAKEKGLPALSLECQDNNVLAARFCQKNGFFIGGVNTELYAPLGAPYASETAVFWYKKV